MAIGTIKELAERAGVSWTTVSLVFQGSPRISQPTRENVLRIAREINYVPNLAARQLRRGKSRIKNIGLLVNDLSNPFYAMMVHSAEQAAAKRGYEILVADTQWNPDKELAELENMVQFRVEGVAACLSEANERSIELLERFPAPYIALDNVPDIYSGPYVANDVLTAARLAAQHLVDIGCKRIVYFDGDESTRSFSSFRKIAEEFTNTLQVNGKTFDNNSIFMAGLTIDSGRKAMDDILKIVPDIDGLFCANTLCAMGAMDTATKRGIKIGSQLSVMGIDDLDICTLDCISLTAIRQPYEQLTEVAMDMLIKSIDTGSPLKLKMSLQPELVIRNSTNRNR
jgi:LacI family transcriptional regulator